MNARSQSILFYPELSEIPRGAITEISGLPGSGKSEAVLRFLAKNSLQRIAWVEENLTIYPYSFLQAGVDPSRVLFSEAGVHASWSTQQILRSRVFPVVVLMAEIDSEVELRRLQLATEKANATLLLLSEEPRTHGTWPIRLRFEASRDPRSRQCRLKRLK